MADFLFEIGLEEVPARMIAGAQAELLRRTLALLGKEALLGETFDPLTDALSYSTPRRLAVPRGSPCAGLAGMAAHDPHGRDRLAGRDHRSRRGRPSRQRRRTQGAPACREPGRRHSRRPA